MLLLALIDPATDADFVVEGAGEDARTEVDTLAVTVADGNCGLVEGVTLELPTLVPDIVGDGELKADTAIAAGVFEGVSTVDPVSEDVGVTLVDALDTTGVGEMDSEGV